MINNYNNRKYSVDQLSESEEQIGSLFPKCNNIDLQNSLEILKEYYNKKLHSFELTNYCYRCPRPEFVQAYNKFKIQNHSELQEPKISNIYQNKSFVDLEELSKRINLQSYQIPGPFIGPVPSNFKNIMNQLFQKYGYLPNLQRFLIFYPTYLQRHILVSSVLFQSDKIDSKVANFLAIIAAAQLGSVYIMARMVNKFLKEGGQKSWITQAKYPTKYKSILQINRLMTRAPWQINSQMIQEIIESNNWSKNQLALCLQVLAFSHQISTIALALGLLPQDPSSLQHLNLSSILQLKETYDKKLLSSTQPQEKLACIVQNIKQKQESQNNNMQSKEQTSTEHTIVTERTSGGSSKEQGVNSRKSIAGSAKTLKKEKKIENTDNYMKQIANELSHQQIYKDINKLVQPLLPTFRLFEDRRAIKAKVLDYSDFNFKFEAYPILYNLTNGIASKLQSLIDYSQIMTRNNFGSQKLNNTKQFRKAVRYYSQNLCLYTHQEYDYKSNIATYLTMALKFYIRLITLSPVHINKQVIQFTNHQCGQQIECFDLGHLAVIVANTKMSLELTMVTQALQQ